jgi:neurofibromin 1
MHKANDTHGFNGSTQPHSILSVGASVTPQQKMIQVLVTRLKNKVRLAIFMNPGLEL